MSSVPEDVRDAVRCTLTVKVQRGAVKRAALVGEILEEAEDARRAK